MFKSWAHYSKEEVQCAVINRNIPFGNICDEAANWEDFLFLATEAVFVCLEIDLSTTYFFVWRTWLSTTYLLFFKSCDCCHSFLIIPAVANCGSCHFATQSNHTNLIWAESAVSINPKVDIVKIRKNNNGSSRVVAHSVVIAVPSHACPPLYRGTRLQVKFNAFSSAKVQKFQYT